MEKTYQLVTDSNCDLPADLVRALDLAVIPMTFAMDGKEYRQYPDNREYDPQQFFQDLRAGKWATTAQLIPEDYISFLSPYLDAGLDILYIGFSSGLSATWQRAQTAAAQLREQYPARHIFCVDSLTATLGQGLLVYLAACQQKEGMPLLALKDWVEVHRLQVSGWFLVDDLNHLKKGGRVSAATALVGSMLSIKPILQIDEQGHLLVREKVRGRRQSMQRLLQKMETRYAPGPDAQAVFIVHGDCPADAKELEKAVKSRFKPKKVYTGCLGPVIGAHTGPNALAIFYLAKDRS